MTGEHVLAPVGIVTSTGRNPANHGLVAVTAGLAAVAIPVDVDTRDSVRLALAGPHRSIVSPASLGPPVPERRLGHRRPVFAGMELRASAETTRVVRLPSGHAVTELMQRLTHQGADVLLSRGEIIVRAAASTGATPP